MHPIIFLPLFIAAIIIISNYYTQRGSIVILEKPDGSGFTINLQEWNSKNKCELFLKKGDVIQIEVTKEEGEIGLLLRGKNGSEPYEGNGLKTTVFTVTISETDNYIFYVSGKKASGKIKVLTLV